MRRIRFAVPPLFLFLVGCGSTQYVSLGTYYVDDAKVPLISADPELPDTLAFLRFADTLEVLDAPISVRRSNDLFLVRSGGNLALAPRDLLISDLLFRSKYASGRPVLIDDRGVRFYVDEFGDRVEIKYRESATPRDTAVTRAPAAEPVKKGPKRTGRRQRG